MFAKVHEQCIMYKSGRHDPFHGRDMEIRNCECIDTFRANVTRRSLGFNLVLPNLEEILVVPVLQHPGVLDGVNLSEDTTAPIVILDPVEKVLPLLNARLATRDIHENTKELCNKCSFSNQAFHDAGWLATRYILSKADWK